VKTNNIANCFWQIEQRVKFLPSITFLYVFSSEHMLSLIALIAIFNYFFSSPGKCVKMSFWKMKIFIETVSECCRARNHNFLFTITFLIYVAISFVFPAYFFHFNFHIWRVSFSHNFYYVSFVFFAASCDMLREKS
jgi:hypothetical protein